MLFIAKCKCILCSSYNSLIHPQFQVPETAPLTMHQSNTAQVRPRRAITALHSQDPTLGTTDTNRIREMYRFCRLQGTTRQDKPCVATIPRFYNIICNEATQGCVNRSRRYRVDSASYIVWWGGATGLISNTALHNVSHSKTCLFSIQC